MTSPPPGTIPQALAVALQHHQAGRLGEAEAIYRQVLAAEPRDANALHLLGVVAYQAGRDAVAAELIRRAIALAPDAAEFHLHLGLPLLRSGSLDGALAAFQRALELKPACASAAQHLGEALGKQGRLDEAIAAYRRAIELQPDFAEAHNNLGAALRERGDREEALAAIQTALRLRPDSAMAHTNLGNARFDQGRIEDAIAAYRRALQLDPACAPAHNNLGYALLADDRTEEAIACFRQALALQPGYAAAHHNLGNALKGPRNLDAAIESYRRALALDPGLAEAWSSLGSALWSRGCWGESAEACRRALALRPDFADAHSTLGIALHALGRLDEASAEFARALELDPGLSEAQINLGNVFKDRARLDEAMECYRRAMALKPGDAGWHGNLVYTALFHPGYDRRALEEECARWRQRHEAPLAHTIRPHANAPGPDRRIRIGYVSPNFCGHVISHFLTPLLEAHDHAGFEVFCYASVARPDATTMRMKKSADVWRDVLGLGDEMLAEQIRADGIDVLVDLTQHMADNRLPVFARRPAPVQVAWLGYPGSTGLHTIDYRLTDAQMEPPGALWSEWVETPVRLPDSWFCFDPLTEYPPPSELPALREGGVTFGSLNNFCKVNDAVLRRWAAVLLAVPGSRLLQQCSEGSHRERIFRLFESQGVARERVSLVARTDTREQFLDLFGRIDVALDPFPYNGGTTTCEALWMGIPVLTLPGEGIVSRIGLSILSAAGMREFVAENEEEYVRLAVELVGDLPRLAQHRATLRERMRTSAFMDAPRFARNIEAAYRGMWRAWCAKQSASEPR